MNGSARVISLDALDRIAAALRAFEEDASHATADLDIEVRRAMQWVQQDRRDFWNQQVRKSEEQFAEARIALERCRMFTAIPGERPSCIDERKALEKAQRRLRIAQEKAEQVRHWSRVIERELLDFKAAMNVLAAWLLGDFPRAVATLERMALALEEYVALQSNVETPPPLNLSSYLESGTEGASADPSTSAAAPSDAADESPPEDRP
jgi:hypothetical protein